MKENKQIRKGGSVIKRFGQRVCTWLKTMQDIVFPFELLLPVRKQQWFASNSSVWFVISCFDCKFIAQLHEILYRTLYMTIGSIITQFISYLFCLWWNWGAKRPTEGLALCAPIVKRLNSEYLYFVIVYSSVKQFQIWLMTSITNFKHRWMKMNAPPHLYLSHKDRICKLA